MAPEAAGRSREGFLEDTSRNWGRSWEVNCSSLSSAITRRRIYSGWVHSEPASLVSISGTSFR